jgi:hypothetical protein
MSSRTGVLSDDQVNKHCAIHRPVPFNRLDLLIPNLKNVSGVYSRKLKEPKVLSRPATAYEMIMELQRLNPAVNILDKYKAMLDRPAPLIPVRPAPADNLAREVQPITQQYYDRPNIADLMYLNIADVEGLLANIIEGTSWGGSAFASSSASVKAPAEEMGEAQNEADAQDERDFILAQLDELDAEDAKADDLNLQEGLEASSSMDAPRTPASRTSAQQLAMREANIDITQAGIINTTPLDIRVLRNRATTRDPSTLNY